MKYNPILIKSAFICFFLVISSPLFAESPKEEKTIILRGKLIHKELPKTKSVEAYLGEEFFLIVETVTKGGPKTEEIVLWPTKTVPEEKLLTLIGKEIVVTVKFVEGKRPDDPYGSYPTDFDGQPLKRGEGYRVLEIKETDLKKDETLCPDCPYR